MNEADPTPEQRPAELNLTEPRSLRVIAHPARQTIITALYGDMDATLTAAEAARLCDLTTAAASYHLRALAKVGVVAPAESRADAREHPWRAAAEVLHLRPATAFPAGAMTGILEAMYADAAAWAGEEDRDEAWAAGAVSGTYWMTAEQTQELAAAVDEVMTSLKKRWSSDADDPGVRRMRVTMSAFRRAEP